MKASMTLHCGCGDNEFYIRQAVNGYDYSIACVRCGEVVATVPTYAFKVIEDEEEEAQKEKANTSNDAWLDEDEKEEEKTEGEA